MKEFLMMKVHVFLCLKHFISLFLEETEKESDLDEEAIHGDHERLFCSELLALLVRKSILWQHKAHLVPSQSLQQAFCCFLLWV